MDEMESTMHFDALFCRLPALPDSHLRDCLASLCNNSDEAVKATYYAAMKQSGKRLVEEDIPIGSKRVRTNYWVDPPLDGSGDQPEEESSVCARLIDPCLAELPPGEVQRILRGKAGSKEAASEDASGKYSHTPSGSTNEENGTPGNFPLAGRKRSIDQIAADAPPAEATSQNKDLKRYHQSLVARCVNCGRQYDKVDDNEQMCKYHSGESQFDEEGWEDHPRPVEVVDNDVMRLVQPDVFVWDCCEVESDGDEVQGRCCIGKHTDIGEKTHFAELQMLREIKEGSSYVLQEQDLNGLPRYG
ncbi:hypothetical protein LTR24_010148 [Lithohypha guttulata]|uniref:C2H2-type domain-containing protein n=1 Tax=Lithohypha guttulata TaxID=1690604 RepID=A0ABR0JWC7_9EURO|nr:hypothetical protein LTR24_010148 [Lithohypha guttulata]